MVEHFTDKIVPVFDEQCENEPTEKEEGSEEGGETAGSSTRVVLSVQKPRPRFNVRVQTGRGEQPPRRLAHWRSASRIQPGSDRVNDTRRE